YRSRRCVQFATEVKALAQNTGQPTREGRENSPFVAFAHRPLNCRLGGDGRGRAMRAARAARLRSRAARTIGFRLAGWWRTQSHANPSPLSNSLLTGKRAGNSTK